MRYNEKWDACGAAISPQGSVTNGASAILLWKKYAWVAILIWLAATFYALRLR